MKGPSKTKKSSKDSAPRKRRLPKAVKIILIVLAVPVIIITTIVAAAYIYIPFQKPTFVNKDLNFQNNLNIPALAQPRMENGEKVFDLTAQQSEVQLLPGQKTTVLGFNGGYLGPTIRALQDDKIHLNVKNSLSSSTTVHWHGMHLPAAMDGGPHQAIKPGTEWQPSWTVENEASTLWYHPHLMGKTGEQVYRGMAGMFTIDDQNSNSLDLPKDYGVDDLPLIVQDREFDKDNQFVYRPDNSDILGHTGMLGDKILVNGTYAPYVNVPAKQVRLRILNGSNARRYNFTFDDHRTFYQIATDGGLLASPVTRTDMILAPGERAEIVIDLAGQTKPLTLMSDAVHEDITVLRFVRNLLRANRDENQVFKILELRPQGTSATSKPLPQKLNTINTLTSDMAVKTRKFSLDNGSKTINGKEMDSKRVDEIVHSGDIEIWEVSNGSGTYHPFHIHAVQFQILTRGGKPPAVYELGWKDTVLIPNGQTVQLIMRFPEFSDPGNPYMYHCHILEHEDMGMMGQFMVVSKETKNENIHVEDMASDDMTHMHTQ